MTSAEEVATPVSSHGCVSLGCFNNGRLVMAVESGGLLHHCPLPNALRNARCQPTAVVFKRG